MLARMGGPPDYTIALESIPAVSVALPGMLCGLAILVLCLLPVRPRIQFFFLSDLLIGMISIAACATLLNFTARHFSKRLAELDIGDTSTLIPSPAVTLSLAVLWFAAGYLCGVIKYSETADALKARRAPLLMAVLSSCGGNALWLGILILNQLCGNPGGGH